VRYGVVPAVAILAIVGAIWAVEQQGRGAGSGLGGSMDGAQVGQAAPEFVATSADGKELRLADLRGQVVLVNFWATWCGPCRAEMPDLDSVYQEYKDRGFVLVGMNYREGPEDVAKFTKDLRVNFPIGLDPDGAIAGQYRVRGFPSSYFIDREGRISEVRIGALSRELVIERLNKLLKGA
jgi:thiol-disulfide isomerase/thioredoxin